MNNAMTDFQDSMPKVAQTLRSKAIKRNARTALFLGIASSGAVVSTPALVVTFFGSLLTMYAWKQVKKTNESI